MLPQSQFQPLRDVVRTERFKHIFYSSGSSLMPRVPTSPLMYECNPLKNLQEPHLLREEARMLHYLRGRADIQALQVRRRTRQELGTEIFSCCSI